MGNKQNIITPAYKQIAIDIAEDIITGKYSIGEKLSGRSTLASHYEVSPETIRRAVYILQDIGILKISKGSGIEIISTENAIKFIEQYKEAKNVNDLRKNILNFIEIQKENQTSLIETLTNLLDITQRFGDLHPFEPFAFHITSDMVNLGKTCSQVNFWQNTNATIIAFKRCGNIILSPGPYLEFMAGDIIYFVGEEESYERVKKLFMPKNL